MKKKVYRERRSVLEEQTDTVKKKASKKGIKRTKKVDK